jgi:Tol biopolymer transport system component
MDRKGKSRPGFLQQFQARVGWWSPDGKWFAFESNRICDNISGDTYAIFIQDSSGFKPARQVTSCDWNAQHPKWFPPGSTGDKVVLIAAVAKSSESNNPEFHIATLDVTAFVEAP